MNKRVYGIIGGILGGLIASVPWIILNVYVGFMLSLLAGLIGLGVDYGYRLFKGPVDSKLPMIINVISYATVVLVTLYIIPVLVIFNSYGVIASPLSILEVYLNIDLTAILFELGIAILFTYLGIKNIVDKVKTETR